MKIWDEDNDNDEEEEQTDNQNGLKSLRPPSEHNSGDTKRKYVQPTQDKFEEFLSKLEDELNIEWTVADDAQSKEIVYETSGVMPEHTGRVLRIFSTIEERTGKARGKGADAIRTVIWDKNMDVPVGGRTKTLRIKTWRKNLKEKIISLIEETKQYITVCDECGSMMVVREGKYGEFLGCSSYPDCENTEQIEE